jgi:hypothetical protein
MEEENVIINPDEANNEKKELLARLQEAMRQESSRMPIDVYNGLVTSIESYYDNKANIAKRKLQYGANPLDYYEARKKGEGMIDTKRYYDASKAETSNISRENLYKMFSAQVVDQLKKGKIIALPETWDIGAHYGETTGDVINYSSMSGSRDLTAQELSDTRNAEFTTAMQDRIDLLVNNSKPEDLYDRFNLDTVDKYQKKPRSNFEFIVQSLSGKKPEAETNTAEAFNRLLSTSSGSMRKVGQSQYFDTNNNPINVQPYKTQEGDILNNKFYQRGFQAAQQRDPNKPIADYIKESYGGKVGYGEDFKTYQTGFFDALKKSGENVMQRTDTLEPAAMKNIKINLRYKDNVINPSVQIGESGSEIGYNDMPEGMKNYVDRVRFLKNISGSLSTAQEQAGGGYSPI